MVEWISLRATAAAPGPSTHQRSLAALGGVLRIHAHIQGRDRERAERRGIGRRRGAWRRHRGHKVEDSGGTFLRYLRVHLNQNDARMLLLLLRLLLQLLLGVEAPTRQLP